MNVNAVYGKDGKEIFTHRTEYRSLKDFEATGNVRYEVVSTFLKGTNEWDHSVKAFHCGQFGLSWMKSDKSELTPKQLSSLKNQAWKDYCVRRWTHLHCQMLYFGKDDRNNFLLPKES